MTAVRGDSAATPGGRGARRWVRPLALVALLGLGLFIAQSPSPPTLEPAEHTRVKLAEEVRRRFDQSVVMLHAKQHEHALVALERLLELAPNMPEAHVNMGFALLGMQRSAQAQAAFERAMALRSNQANAYYGLALTYEQQGDLELALGAMRSYLHLSRKDDGYQAKARAALWEWEQRLGRHPPSPPGTTAPR